MTALRRTPIYPHYAIYPEARCIDFGGWELPVQFIGIQKEHDAVRQRAGLFDVSHMGELIVRGRDAASFLQRMTTNDVERLRSGHAQYTLLCNPDGGVVEDLLIYQLDQDEYMLVVNAANIEKDMHWLLAHVMDHEAVFVTNRSEQIALLALQGPLAEHILQQVTQVSLQNLLPFQFITGASVCGVAALISRTGYTGEDGFELYVQAEDAAQVWLDLLSIGEPLGLIPAGLGARDTLRFEARLPLYGHELSEEITPLEAGLGMFVKLNKGEFIGRDALIQQKSSGLPRKLVGLELIDRGIPRAHYPVYAQGELIGEVTTGTQSPTWKRNLGLALVNAKYSVLDTKIEVEIRGRLLQAKIVPTPFYKRNLT
ncbi:glycine cleavage system protein T [Paenibacillus selenitireducens]|uniref:Aminomethyltransferase n=1 Tax=Paenibacillus selenitireducens TaxID=1324314 RepID=A0A1T2XD76_9BACL|nr:glycine cleavage system aminomethyltransferase GcvT [Paenibacillus selenitireducens]OPA77732.1 glycine cleavage system protein T [Paenibacillus selenitireducens]